MMNEAARKIMTTMNNENPTFRPLDPDQIDETRSAFPTLQLDRFEFIQTDGSSCICATGWTAEGARAIVWSSIDGRDGHQLLPPPPMTYEQHLARIRAESRRAPRPHPLRDRLLILIGIIGKGKQA